MMGLAASHPIGTEPLCLAVAWFHGPKAVVDPDTAQSSTALKACRGTAPMATHPQSLPVIWLTLDSTPRRDPQTDGSLSSFMPSCRSQR